jgi:hypothetical protein
MNNILLGQFSRNLVTTMKFSSRLYFLHFFMYDVDQLIHKRSEGVCLTQVIPLVIHDLLVGSIIVRLAYGLGYSCNIPSSSSHMNESNCKCTNV